MFVDIMCRSLQNVHKFGELELAPADERRAMGVLIDGIWRDEELPQETGSSGEFRRADSRFRDRITADGSSGFKAEPDRLSPLRRARLPMGAPHPDLSRAQEARRPDLGRLRNSWPKEERRKICGHFVTIDT